MTLKHITSENKAATHYSVHTSKMGATIAAAVSSEMVGGNAPSPLHGTETAQVSSSCTIFHVVAAKRCAFYFIFLDEGICI